MTNAQSKTAQNGAARKSNIIASPIPLDREEVEKLSKHEVLSMKLRTTPGDANSMEYEMTIPFFRSGSPEKLLEFIKRLRRVFVGTNLTTGPEQYAMARRLLEGDALAAFERAATAHGGQTVANMTLCLQDLRTHVFPLRALQNQKRYMRRNMRKPKEMTMREYANRVQELNTALQQFPPFGANQELPDDEVLEILEFGIPRRWKKEMITQNFDPQAHTINDFVQFCERMESTEEYETKQPNAESNNKKRKSTDRHDKKRSESTGPGEKYCMLHGRGNHSTDECKTLQNQTKRMKGAFNAQTPEGKKRFKQREELHNLIAKSVETALKSRSNKAAKKALDEYQYDEESTTKTVTTTEEDDPEVEVDFDEDEFNLLECTPVDNKE